VLLLLLPLLPRRQRVMQQLALLRQEAASVASSAIRLCQRLLKTTVQLRLQL